MLWIEATGKMAAALAFRKAGASKYTSSQDENLGGGRSAPSAMKGKGIGRRCVLRQRKIPSNDLRCADEIEPGSRQRRHVQRLADMAGIVGALGVPMGQRCAKREVQQSTTGYQRENTARRDCSANSPLQVHKRHFSLAL